MNDRTDAEKAIAALKILAKDEMGPFNTSWPFDVILKYIKALEKKVKEQS